MTYWADFIQKQKTAREKGSLELADENLTKALKGKLDEVGKRKIIQWDSTKFVLEETYGKAPQNVNLGAGEKPVIVKIVIDKEKAEKALKEIEEDESSKNNGPPSPEKTL